MPAAPLDPTDVELLRDGAMTVRQAAEFSGLSRTELFSLMGAGTLPWFKYGRYRMLPRRALVEYLVRLYAASKA